MKLFVTDMPSSRTVRRPKEEIRVCVGGGCIASGSLDVKAAFEEALKEQGLEGKISVVGTGCLGPCARGPVVMIGKDNVFYQKVRPDDVEEIVEKHLIGGKVVERLTWKDGIPTSPLRRFRMTLISSKGRRKLFCEIAA